MQEQRQRPKNLPVSVRSIQDQTPDRLSFLKDTWQQIRDGVTQITANAYHVIWASPSRLDWQIVKDVVTPILYTIPFCLMGEIVTVGLSRATTDKEENDFVYKFLFGAAMVAYSISSRLSENRMPSSQKAHVTAAGEILSLAYLYIAPFYGTRRLLAGHVSETPSFLAACVVSGVLVPDIITSLAHLYETSAVKRSRAQGKQLSVTATISSGRTKIVNRYLQLYHFLRPELITVSRLFQIALLIENLLDRKRKPDEKKRSFIQRIRNLPAFFIDLMPPLIKAFREELKKIDNDYVYNNTEQVIVQLKENQVLLSTKKRKDLRSGDLVRVDFADSPLSGAVLALEISPSGQLTHRLVEQKLNANFQAQNGEPNWRVFKTPSQLDHHLKEVGLDALHAGKQIVLKGTKIDSRKMNNLIIQVKPEKKPPATDNYRKTSVINQIIVKHKQNCVMQAITSALFTTLAIHRTDYAAMPATFTTLLLNLYQMLIPFAEGFLRDIVNMGYKKELTALETIDAQRTVDFFHGLSKSYYKDRFPLHVVMLSDKTGTLTTTEMNVKGIWHTPNSQDKDKLACFECFIAAFQNNKKELEAEEAAILQFFKKSFNPELEIETYSTTNLKKTYQLNGVKKTIETFQLGLYHRSMGGRLSLVIDGDKKRLIFCGVPKETAFKNTPLFADYSAMQIRTGVLSRDWCVAHTDISEDTFKVLKQFFDDENEQEIETYLLSHPDVLNNLKHAGTFIIDNPVKTDAEKFIGQYANIGVPVIIATGDNAKAAENIAKVLCADHVKNIFTIRSNTAMPSQHQYPPNSTVIFAGLNKEILQSLDVLLKLPISERPIIIFAELSTADKGSLASFLKSKGYFVVANGDGTNDVSMMRVADFVIAHEGDDGSFAPDVEQFVNISTQRLQKLFKSELPFYTLFDAHLGTDSKLLQMITPFANAQEAVSYGLIMKSAKLSFEIARALGANVIEMWQQHWCSILWDFGFFGISIFEVYRHAGLPVDNKPIDRSWLPVTLMAETLSFAASTAALRYATSGQSTNWDTMAVWLLLLPVAYECLFAGFKHVQRAMMDGPVALPKSPALAQLKQHSIFASPTRQGEDSKAVLVRRPHRALS